ncbi:MAG: hypothetical protein VX252_08125 [Myxococcota bacterium]|nr:hypothetical protein [Myxococcota bacterium]
MTGLNVGQSIVFVAVPDFYAEVERRDQALPRDRPILVGGSPTKRGKVQAADRKAREEGIRVGMPMREAMTLCPSAVCRPTNMKLYREVSGAFVSCLRQYFSRLEIGGLGEVYSELPRRTLDVGELAEQVLTGAHEEMGLPMRLGMAPSKLVARLAAEEAPHGSMKCLAPDAVAGFLGPLSLSRLPRVGEKTAIRLGQLGASTVKQLLALDSELIEEEFGNHGLSILEMARGRDRSVIRAAPFPHSISREETLSAATTEEGDWKACLSRLAGAIETSLSKQGLSAGRLAVGVRLKDETRQTRSQTLKVAVERAPELYQAATDLLARCDLPEDTSLRSLRIVVAGLEPTRGISDQQLDLFGPAPR